MRWDSDDQKTLITPQTTTPHSSNDCLVVDSYLGADTQGKRKQIDIRGA